eukprot:GCRY01001140.1.p1 GENE.GCRY01001140.1~~GCRY01001140.1.p1  ORF type:complete len:204 (-),score=34.20 GCRY01001140.1:127-663(-)
MSKPSLKWAQREDRVFVTVDLQDIAPVLTFTENKFNFSAEKSGKKFEVEVETFKPIKPDECKWTVTGRHVEILLIKAEVDKDEWWPRLQKEKVKLPYIKIDWDKWVDEDDDPVDDSALNAFGGAGGEGGMPDMSALMQQFGGGMGGNTAGMDMSKLMAQGNGLGDEEDSDDEDIPELE